MQLSAPPSPPPPSVPPLLEPELLPELEPELLEPELLPELEPELLPELEPLLELEPELLPELLLESPPPPASVLFEELEELHANSSAPSDAQNDAEPIMDRVFIDDDRSPREIRAKEIEPMS